MKEILFKNGTILQVKEDAFNAIADSIGSDYKEIVRIHYNVDGEEKLDLVVRLSEIAAMYTVKTN